MEKKPEVTNFIKMFSENKTVSKEDYAKMTKIELPHQLVVEIANWMVSMCGTTPILTSHKKVDRINLPKLATAINSTSNAYASILMMWLQGNAINTLSEPKEVPEVTEVSEAPKEVANVG